MTKVTLEQWRVLQTVIDEGSFAKAAIKLHKSQSNISYTITKLQDMLGLQLLQLEGRRAVLTEQGVELLKRSRQVTRAAKNLENAALNLKSNHEKSLRLAIDELFPSPLLMVVLQEFGQKNKHTKLIINQGLLSGPSDQLINGDAELALISKIPEGYTGNKLMDVHFLPYAHKDSPLHQKQVTLEDLHDERYLIAQDSGLNKKRNEGWLGSEFHWKVSTLEMKIQCVVHGIGFAWLPQQIVEARNLPILPVNMEENNIRTYPVYLVHHQPQEVGPSAQLLIDLFKKYAYNK
ncbi:LysR family transcriptional regulator [Legionella anisa]|uniref:LysR family transcriptional regulator n=1 Tax=Legionella anisa TaxID=28082 RepID=A0AAX0WX62_9GAMM|nr:LysR family transcriptional regulator [Legionella anisa]AWN72480.1 LysR family transcriptional regulator [Legionella anisa]KTC72355.1 LysR family transporter transcriptional regulator [Legionella anisa]MBN5935569.1 LysR family transcriptional regulator [Legionella anisa]MCW8423244.1 LysR family transcriptional regulator [Legionella anisa]MCW8446762.1 LysR family transcriptional regulator [Legionella anisa]